MNKNRKISFSRVKISLVITFILTSCNGVAMPGIPASPTATPVIPTPTLTVALSMPPTATLAPSATTVPTATATAVPTAQLAPQVNPGMNAYCRKGPGTDYDIVTFLQVGTFYPVLGQNGLNTWWQVQATTNAKCWIGDPTAVFQGSMDQVPILPSPPLPAKPASFIVYYSCNSQPRSLVVTYEWTPVVGATGYRIYRNGDLLQELGPNSKNGSDPHPPLAVDLVYELQAFNEYGVSPRIAFTKISACGD